jgi:uncharacterized membrane protein (UPF0182 family)
MSVPNRPIPRLRSSRPRRRSLVIVATVVVLLLLLPALVRIAAEWPWFQAIGYERVFTTRLVAEALLGAAVAVVAFTFLYVNLRLAS